ncbi:MAG: MTH1187 family thiamine-binding protein [Solirubrobacterales bacterium]|nr:MTH1187 family thiamine-binding protein [Solirubrobacterales bacterium]
MATADITILGLRTGPDSHASEYIAEIQRRLSQQSKVAFQLHGMGTSLEGTADDIFALAAELHKIPLELGIPRVYTVLKLDEPSDKPDQTLADKVDSVRDRL